MGQQTPDAGQPGQETSPRNPDTDQRQARGAADRQAFDWQAAGLDSDSLNLVQNKGFRGPKDLVESYRNLERLMGAPADRIVKLPQTDDPALWRPAYERLGAGKTADDYQLPIPEGSDGEFAKTAAKWMHEIGIPVPMAKTLVEKFNAHAAEQATAQQTEIRQRDETQLAQLKAEWGANMQANTVIVDRAAEAFGMNAEQIDALRQAMGPGEAMKFLLNIGSKLGVEDQFVSGESRNTGFTQGGSPEQAKARINELRNDQEFVKRYAAGDAVARRELERLHRIAYPES